MNILITGVLGHIGSSLLDNLSKIKNLKKVYLIDNARSNNLNILFNLKNKRVKINFIYGDLINKKIFNKINDKIHTVIHLASITNAEQSFKNKKLIFENNYSIFKNVVNFCLKKNARLIHLSSTSVYGQSEKIVDENFKDLEPRSPYAEEKLLEENYLKRLKKIKFITFRLGTISGISKGMRFHTAVNKFCLKTILGEEIPVWTNALHQYRPYCSLKDATNAIIQIINKNAFDNQIYNVLTKNYRFDGFYWRPIHLASHLGNKELVELLISKGVDINTKTGGEERPLHYAAIFDQKEIIPYLARNNDILNGGEGAPLTPVYHSLLSKKIFPNEPCIFLNIGGVSNFTYCNNDELVARDIGPGNVLIDEYLKTTKNIDFDKNGEIASTGQINMDIINQFIEHDIYSSQDRHSYDRNEFDFNFIKGLVFEDAVATLNYFTALIISNYLNNNFINCSKVILCGGGRKNKTLMQNLKNLLKKNIIEIDKYNYDGDFIESQAFAYLAIRSYLKKNISFPSTTKVSKPVSGGEIFKNF